MALEISSIAGEAQAEFEVGGLYLGHSNWTKCNVHS
jgi:hypothetical protein